MTSPGIGASGVLGIALEAVSGTYVAPTKFVPFLSESLQYQQATGWRRPIRNTPGLVGAISGNAQVTGDVVIESLADVLPYFLMASRCTVEKTGAAAPFTYDFTPSPNAIPTKTLSITLVRNGVVFGYTGCTVTDIKMDVSDGILQFTASIIATNEESQAAVTGITWPTSEPFGSGSYNLQIPTASQVFDTDTFSFESNDNGTVQFRLKDTLGAQFVSFGESDASISVARDFVDRTEYDAFKTLTEKSITLEATHGAVDTDVISITAPVAIVDTYEVAIGSQGDLVRASITYQCAIDSTGKHYAISITTDEDVTVA